MELHEFEALSFDCYGTLIDWESGLAAVLGPWARAAGVTLDDDELLARFAAHETLEQQRDPAARYPVILARTMEAIGAELGAPVPRADAMRLAASVGEWPPFPDSPAALASLGERFRLIILSNVDRASFAGSQARLGAVFDAVVTAEDVGAYKPSPRAFEALLAAARGLGVREGRLLHVAQSLYHDHEPAHRAGLPTVWIDRRRGRPGWGAIPPPGDAATSAPDWVFASLAELAEASRPPSP